MQMRDARRVAPDDCRRTRLCHCIYECRDRLGPGGQHFFTLILAPLGKDPAIRQPGALGIGRVRPFRGIDVAAKLLKCIVLSASLTFVGNVSPSPFLTIKLNMLL